MFKNENFDKSTLQPNQYKLEPLRREVVTASGKPAKIEESIN